MALLLPDLCEAPATTPPTTPLKAAMDSKSSSVGDDDDVSDEDEDYVFFNPLSMLATVPDVVDVER